MFLNNMFSVPEGGGVGGSEEQKGKDVVGSEEQTAHTVEGQEEVEEILNRSSNPSNSAVAEVDFCCVKNIPFFLPGEIREDDVRIVYDPSCLSCRVVDVDLVCNTRVPDSVEVTFPAAKLVGCMPYQIETRFDRIEDLCPTPIPTQQLAIVCVDAVRFRNILAASEDKEEMEELCRKLNKKLKAPRKKCDIVQVKRKKVRLKECKDEGYFVQFTGTFEVKLPNC